MAVAALAGMGIGSPFPIQAVTPGDSASRAGAPK
jgi:hypothetical protein